MEKCNARYKYLQSFGFTEVMCCYPPGHRGSHLAVLPGGAGLTWEDRSIEHDDDAAETDDLEGRVAKLERRFASHQHHGAPVNYAIEFFTTDTGMPIDEKGQ